jgi:hypothetical protein
LTPVSWLANSPAVSESLLLQTIVPPPASPWSVFHH